MATYEDVTEEERQRRAGEPLPYAPDPLPEPEKPPEPPIVSTLPGGGYDVFNPPATTPPPSTGGGGGGGGAPAPRPAAPTFSFQPPATGGFQTPGAGVPATVGQAKAPVITDELTAILRDRLNALKNPLDVTSDPIFQNQVKAQNIQSQRDTERARASAAQRAAVGGALQSGGFNTAVRSLNEQQGRANQAFVADLAGTRLREREAQLNVAISMARSVGQDDVALQLENIKVNLQNEALRLQERLGLADIDLRRYLGESGIGFNYASLQANMNRDSVLSLL